MSSKRIFIIILTIAIISGLIYWSYPIIKERYFPQTQEEIQKEIKSEPVKINNENLDIKSDPDESSGITESEGIKNETGDKNNDDKNTETEPSVTIDSDDCDNECEGFSGKDLKYCQQVCGLAATLEEAASCDNKSGIQKDYCLKDLAISKKDFKICEEIKDDAIKKTCKNRVTEDIFDE